MIAADEKEVFIHTAHGMMSIILYFCVVLAKISATSKALPGSCLKILIYSILCDFSLKVVLSYIVE